MLTNDQLPQRAFALIQIQIIIGQCHFVIGLKTE